MGLFSMMSSENAIILNPGVSINVINVDKEEQRAKYWALWHARYDRKGGRRLSINYHLLFSVSGIIHNPVKNVVIQSNSLKFVDEG